MKIALLFDGLSALGKAPEVQLLDSIEAVESALLELATEVVRGPVSNDGRWVERVRKGKFDLVFHLCEGIDGEAVYEAMVISVLELIGVPFTGSSSWTTALTLRKNVVNGVLDRAGLPVPRWSHVRRGDEITSVGFPAICKPVAEDASVGIEQRSVVRSMRALSTRVEAMFEGWDEVLIQRFIDGREVNVNPDISPTAGLARMAGVATLSYGDLIRKICDHALAKRGSNYTERFVKTLRLSGLG